MKQLCLFTALLLAPLAASLDASEPIKLPPKEKFHLFLLVGQSNMAGRGAVADQDTTVHPRVLMLSKAGEWVPAIDPMHFDKPSAGVGLGRTFGIQIADANPDIAVGLIPCAVGGSPIDTWKPGEFYAATKSHPWDDAIQRAKLAQKSGELKGILWHQGESDCTKPLAPTYEAKLHTLVNEFRKELGADIPFIAGQLGQFPDNPWDDARMQVDKALRDLPKQVPYTAFVESVGLKHKGDKTHFDAAAYREFGKRYAEAYMKLIEAK